MFDYNTANTIKYKDIKNVIKHTPITITSC